MITRRSFLGAVSAFSAAQAFNRTAFSLSKSAISKSGGEAKNDVTKFVNIKIGTGGHGHTYPGATVPFGMVQLSPDTYTDGWDWCSGYYLTDTSIMGFTHTHLSGTGGADLLDFLVMPGTGPAKTEPGSRENPDEGYRSRFSHDEEIATPGYYSVLLKDYGIRAEMTATERVGFHKYTFPKSDSSHMIVDLVHGTGKEPSIIWAELQVVNGDTLLGGRKMHGWADGRELYFAMKFSKPATKIEILSDGNKLDGSTKEAKGKALKCLLHFETSEGEAVYVKTGLSSVSAAGALNNLNSEVPDWDFEKVRSAARASWQQELSKIHIETSSEKNRIIFYTALYHMMVAPTLFDDVDGKYRGMDAAVHQLKEGEHNYSTYSLWDTYRAAHPMYTLIQQERVPELINCLIRMSVESPDGPPVWPLQARETGCMVGYHSAPVIAEAIVKGFKVNTAEAYPPYRKRAMVDDYRGLSDYRKYGYIPCDLVDESASKTLDYAYDDWAVAQIARAAGAKDLHDALVARSKNYQHLFDKQIGFIRPKLSDGKWAGPFDPKEISITKKWRDFTESNSWQTTFAVQHDPKGLIELFGGRDEFMKKLDALFEQSTTLPADMPPDVAGLVGMYAHGNEPSHHITYLYAYAGAPYKTQKWVRSLMETMYRNDPDGLAGNEDCGQMSAWYVMSSLGFYPVDPVSGNYVFGSPLFDKVEVELGNGKKLIVEARNNSPENVYVQSVKFNGKPHHKSWFRHADIVQGATIVFEMGDKPNEDFGKAESALPPSLPA